MKRRFFDLVFLVGLCADCSNSSFVGSAGTAGGTPRNATNNVSPGGGGSGANANPEAGGGAATAGGSGSGGANSGGGTGVGNTSGSGGGGAGSTGGNPSAGTGGTGGATSPFNYVPDSPLTPEDTISLNNCMENLGANAQSLGSSIPVKVIDSGSAEFQGYQDLVQTSTPTVVLVNLSTTQAGLAAHLALQNDNGIYCIHIQGGTQVTATLIELACHAQIVSADVDSPTFQTGIVRTSGATADEPGMPCLGAGGLPIPPILQQGGSP